MNAARQNDATRFVSVQAMERLTNWAGRKPVIALMGEFSSGKSTLLNLLVGQTILPMKVTATRLPPVWFQYGDKPSFWVDKDGHRHAVDVDNLESVPLNDARFIRIYAMSEQLKECDLIDTPGISDPNIPTDQWISSIGYANCVLWCTHAGQAWRESERSQWENLPERLRENSILLVTRADKIVSRVDLDKINRRLKRETDDLFSTHHFISLTTALKSREGDGNANLWSRSGAGIFMDSFKDVLAKVIKARSVQLRRYQATDGNSSASQNLPTSAVGGENSMERSDDNIVTLRPMRIHSASSRGEKTRLKRDEAAQMRQDMLTSDPPLGNDESSAVASAPKSEGMSLRSQDESA